MLASEVAQVLKCTNYAPAECLDMFTIPQVIKGNIPYNHLSITGLHILVSEKDTKSALTLNSFRW